MQVCCAFVCFYLVCSCSWLVCLWFARYLHTTFPPDSFFCSCIRVIGSDIYYLWLCCRYVNFFCCCFLFLFLAVLLLELVLGLFCCAVSRFFCCCCFCCCCFFRTVFLYFFVCKLLCMQFVVVVRLWPPLLCFGFCSTFVVPFVCFLFFSLFFVLLHLFCFVRFVWFVLSV